MPNKQVPKAFVEWLNRQMEERDWSVRETARSAGISHTPISYIISNNEIPSFDTCKALARAFGVPAQFVVELAGLLPKVSETKADAMELGGLLEGLTPESKREILVMVRALRAEKLRTDKG